MRLDPALPFILFDDARADGPVRVYRNALGKIAADTLDEVEAALASVQTALSARRHIAGWIAYEAGGAFEPRMARDSLNGPLLSFGIYERATFVDWTDIAALVAGRRTEIGALHTDVSEAEHADAIGHILDLIHAGDIYQANLTLPLTASYRGHPLALYARLRAAQTMPHGALVHEGGGKWLLSASPELFFRIENGVITARPMKGTAARQPGAAADQRAAWALAHDGKNRAENLMITDLIRNDLSRVAVPGSVRVEDAFHVEPYPTVYQMVTTVKADLIEKRNVLDVMRAMFPCGSITGAPKVRAGEVINKVEWRMRGLYTGSIGWMEPGGDAAFNVAIRTAELQADGNEGTLRMGVGAGIVADSDARGEWDETLAKAAFLQRDARAFHLIETMLFEPSEGMVRLDLHMQRLKASAARLGFRCDTHEICNLLQAVIGRERRARRVKVTLARDGSHACALTDVPPAKTEMTVSLVPLPVDPADWRLFHKSSDRDFYDRARHAAHGDEVAFVRRDGLLTEGSFTNLFVRRDGRYLTPRVESGLLAGILRAEMLEDGSAAEADLTADDLRAASDAGELFVGNSLRGLIPAKHVAVQ
ncbi:MAG: aminodeoxychorismate synthase component I [Pacificimonas sp.]